jgi:hypothetical protein
MNRDDCYSATHPSEHNSVHILDRSDLGRDIREVEWRKRREKEGEKIGKGKRRGKNTELEERYMRGRSHDFPFLMPTPKSHGYGCPHVQPRYAAGCAAVCPLPAFFISFCDNTPILGRIWLCRMLGHRTVVLSGFQIIFIRARLHVSSASSLISRATQPTATTNVTLNFAHVTGQEGEGR